MNSTQEIGHGIECHVYDIGNNRCYKRYDYQYTQPDTPAIYVAAQLAADNGLGPDVYEQDDYGYVTEIVETIDDCDDKGYCGGQCEYCGDMPINMDDYFELKTKLEELFGHTIQDLHIGNLGYKNGKLICIDFGAGIGS